MKRIVVGFIGPAKSGKTELILKLAHILQEKGFKVCAIKHDSKDQAIFDQEGKDSNLLFQGGLDTAIISPSRTTIFQRVSYSIDDVIKVFDHFDYLFVEGFSDYPIPHIAIFDQNIQSKYLERCEAVICKRNCEEVYKYLSKKIKLIDKNDMEYLVQWIDQYGEKHNFDTIVPL